MSFNIDEADIETIINEIQEAFINGKRSVNTEIVPNPIPKDLVEILVELGYLKKNGKNYNWILQ